MVFKVVVWAISGCYSVFLGSLVYSVGVHVIRVLFVFLLLLYLFITVLGLGDGGTGRKGGKGGSSAKNLEG